MDSDVYAEMYGPERLAEAVAGSAAVVLALPGADATFHLVSEAVFDTTDEGTIVVNVGRGTMVEEGALIAALESGKVGFAALDVVEDEPVAADHPLTAYPSVTLTPHVAWYSEESYAELKRRVVENVAEVCAGRTPRNILNPEVLPG
ncbi:D-isomer specific 2-hydroxyacid dehydrogenase, NAD binding domain [Ruaniaceae bacterium KH17]|nr:D-isomer specific 2-hydroxyacid dehydrogenase, NAD binding domain [Ruaniaceae bacterium KH17]